MGRGGRGRGGYRGQSNRGGNRGGNKGSSVNRGQRKTSAGKTAEQPATPQTPLIALPEVNIAELEEKEAGDVRKNFVGNAIYPRIEASFGAALAPNITGMLLDEEIVDYK
jgi:hypothetical protein